MFSDDVGGGGYGGWHGQKKWKYKFNTFKTQTPIYVLKQAMCPTEREIDKTLYGNQKFKKWYRVHVFYDSPPELRSREATGAYVQ